MTIIFAIFLCQPRKLKRSFFFIIFNYSPIYWDCTLLFLPNIVFASFIAFSAREVNFAYLSRFLYRLPSDTSVFPGTPSPALPQTQQSRCTAASKNHQRRNSHATVLSSKKQSRHAQQNGHIYHSGQTANQHPLPPDPAVSHLCTQKGCRQ